MILRGIKHIATNNLTEVDHGEILKDYADYLVEGEEIEHAFKLIRDAVIFTNKRIITVDVMGLKSRVIASIYFGNITNVSIQTAGRGFDDSNVIIQYIAFPLSKQVQFSTLEFPKNFDYIPLYNSLMEQAMINHGIEV